MRTRAQAYRQAFEANYPNHLVIFASKSFNCKASCAIMAQEGLGIDVVSAGELYTALSVNFPTERIIFHGNNKSLEEIEMAIDNEIGSIMLDNWLELSFIEKVAKAKPNKQVNLTVRITPGIECHTHEYIKTGSVDSKFGFNLAEMHDVIAKIIEIQKTCSNIKLKGLHAHIGSQIFETVAHKDTCAVIIELYAQIKEKFGIELEDINVGGGLGIKYMKQDDPPNIADWVKIIADAIKTNCQKFNIKEPRVLVEPGRSMVGPAGATIYEVGNIKHIPELNKTYVAVDGGMSDNARPIMYQAEYTAEVDSKTADTDQETVTIAGKFCESGDILIKEIELPKIQTEDIIAIYSTGAYNYSMASNYNRIRKPAVVLVKDGQANTIIEREDFKDIVRNDKLPEHLSI